ncbi:PAAR domain-containing protein [Pseudescherichia sp.]|uniref:PAAR domain-containing protein n=1 Tax=Pseudescherichia sp. TaxID=2055881 RepID=UPI0028A8B905|nr:PAAR domain-containing protein [Pseudescherichia sp.]
MATGFYLRVGDHTTCGGKILTGTPELDWYGANAAREGDLVSCGKNPGVTYKIIGGTESFMDERQRLAGTLDSFSSCPCKARFIPSIPDCYEEETFSSLKRSSVAAAVFVPAAVMPKRFSESEPEQHAQAVKKKSGTDAGFAVIPYGGTANAWQRQLFASNPPSGAEELFASLNGAGKEYKASSILLLVDPEKQASEQINHMKTAKQRIDVALEPLTHQEANFLHQHYATIANFSNIADKGIGLLADPVGKYFENIEKILNEIQQTYKSAYLTRGALIGAEFYVKRAHLFKELESVLKVGFLNKAMKFGEYTKIKNALGLSTSAITYKWNETGIDDIEGYATHIERAAKYVKAMRYTGYVGIGFSALHSLNEIHEACSVGREVECTKKKYTEIGGFSGGIIGGIAGGAVGTGICTLVLGTATIEVGGAGALACGVILGTSGSYAGGEYLSSKGVDLGESIYETAGK